MSGNVIQFTGTTIADLLSEQILSEAIKADLDEVLVIGRTKSGDKYFACSFADIGRVNIWLDKMKIYILEELLP